ncbi:MAG TPA: hypothetical protein VI279_09050 [Rhodocyclaceae bacterium]
MANKRHPIFRWLNIALRGGHMMAVIALGGACLGAPLPLESLAYATLGSGLALLLLELWADQVSLREAAGAATLLKLGLVGLMPLLPAWRLPLFWLIVGWSVIFSHAPKTWRHASLPFIGERTLPK